MTTAAATVADTTGNLVGFWVFMMRFGRFGCGFWLHAMFLPFL